MILTLTPVLEHPVLQVHLLPPQIDNHPTPLPSRVHYVHLAHLGARYWGNLLARHGRDGLTDDLRLSVAGDLISTRDVRADPAPGWPEAPGEKRRERCQIPINGGPG